MSTLAFNPNETQLATTHEDDTVRIWDTQSRQQIVLLDGLNTLGSRPAMSISLDNQFIATASENGTYVWDMQSANPLCRLSNLLWL